MNDNRTDVRCSRTVLWRHAALRKEGASSRFTYSLCWASNNSGESQIDDKQVEGSRRQRDSRRGR